MKPIRIAIYAIAICGVLTFVHSLAFGAGGTAAPADPSALTLSMFYPVLAALCGAAAGCIRGKTNSDGFWHQWYGQPVIMIGGAFLGSLSEMLARGAITKLALIGAAAGAIGGWASALQNTAVDVKAAASKTLQMIVLGLAVGQLGCATMGGNTKAFGLAYAACMEAKGISAAEAAGQEAFTDLTSSANAATIESQLVALAGRVGTDAVSCAVAAFLHPANPAELPREGLAAAKWWQANRGKVLGASLDYDASGKLVALQRGRRP